MVAGGVALEFGLVPSAALAGSPRKSRAFLQEFEVGLFLLLWGFHAWPMTQRLSAQYVGQSFWLLRSSLSAHFLQRVQSPFSDLGEDVCVVVGQRLAYAP